LQGGIVEVELNEEQRILQQTVREFLEREAPLSALRERAAKNDSPFDPDYWQRAATLGFAAMLVPEDLGGVGGDQPVLDLAIVAEEMGRRIAPGPLLPSAVVVDALIRAGSREQQEEFLPPIADGSVVAAWAVGEPPDRWDSGSVTTRAANDGTGWVLHGEKLAVEAADIADVFLVVARTQAGLGQFLIPRDSPGLSVMEMPQYDLGRVFGNVTLENVLVPVEKMVGEPGNSDESIDHQFLLALTIQAAETVGLLERIFNSTVDYMQDRYTFGRPLASYQALKHRVADHKMWLEAALGVSSALAHATADGDARAATLASAAKAHIGEQSLLIISDCAQLFGGIAMTWEHDLHLYLRRATANKFLYGSPAQHKERLCVLAGV
jgi:alkylation response protein AidB-like acyl-CoA dehydrogenase